MFVKIAGNKMTKPFSRLNLEGQLERVGELEQGLAETMIFLNDCYWVTEHEEVRTRIEDIAKNYGDKQFIEMLDETKRKLPWKNKQSIIYISDEPNWVSPYD